MLPILAMEKDPCFSSVAVFSFLLTLAAVSDPATSKPDPSPHAVLSAPACGKDALHALGKQLPKIAARYHQSAEQLRHNLEKGRHPVGR
jgi:hypothetical protein